MTLRIPLFLGLLLLLSPAKPATAQATLATLFSFPALNANGHNPDGAHPHARLILGSDGSFYGTATDGGAGGTGTVFRLTPSGTVTTLYAFSALGSDGLTNADGARPYGALAQGRDGNFYGTTAGGGAHGTGTVFQLTSGGALTTLHAFSALGQDGASNIDGAHPHAGLTLGSNGSLYGSAPDLGKGGTGTLFQITTGGVLTVLHAFGKLSSLTDVHNTDGAFPYAALTQGADSTFYGTTGLGYGTGTGTIFKVSPAGFFTRLYAFETESFATNIHGADASALVPAPDGSFYGATFYGGTGGTGTVFKMTPGGALTTLYTFSAQGASGLNAEGAFPNTLTLAPDGVLYGTTSAGSTTGYGSIFKIALDGTFTLLSPLGTPNGLDAFGALCSDGGNSLYGVTTRGGNNDTGTILQFSLPAPAALQSLSTTTVPAGHPSFTLTLTGQNFRPDDTVTWDGSPLATTFVSAGALKAIVPAARVSTPGTASVTVTHSGGSRSSNAKAFTILATAFQVAVGAATRSSGAIAVSIRLTNSGYATAAHLHVTQVTLAMTDTSSPLPMALGTLSPGGTVHFQRTFPGTTGTPGASATLTVSGTYDGGVFSRSQPVTIP